MYQIFMIYSHYSIRVLLLLVVASSLARQPHVVRGGVLADYFRNSRVVNPLRNHLNGNIINHRLLVGDDAFAWYPCRQRQVPKAALDIQNVTLLPARITRGSSAVFTIVSTAVETDISHVGDTGVVDMSVSLHGLQVFSEVDSLCDKTECPIPDDGSEFDIQYSRDFPIYTPPGRYHMELYGHFEDGGQRRDLFCIEMEFTVHFF
jgi:hypothetical protein